MSEAWRSRTTSACRRTALRASADDGHQVDNKELNEMKNRDKWQPSKYVFRKGKLVASRDLKEEVKQI